MVVRPAVPRLEVVAESERRAVPVVADEERVPERAVRLGLDLRRRLARLVRHEVVIHAHDAERVPDERQLEQREAPDAVALDGPRAEKRLAARVVEEAPL